MPQEKPPFVEKPLLGLTRLVMRFPITTLVLGGLVALGALVYSNYRLGFHTNRLDLVNPKSEFNRLWLDYVREFGDEDDVVIVVEGSSPQKVVAARDEIAAAVSREKRYFYSVLSEIDAATLEAKGLYYLPLEALEEIEDFVDQAEPIVRNRWASLNVGAMAGEMLQAMQQAGARGDTIPPEVQARTMKFLESLAAGLQGRYQSPWPEMKPPPADPEEIESARMLANGGRMAFVLFNMVREDTGSDFVRDSKPIDVLRRLIAQAQARHPQTKIGLTGLPVIEHDEKVSSQNSMAEISLVSLLGVSLLFVAGFGGWRHPLLAVASLTIGTAWSMGYITLVIGHLNILSSAFAVILIGQGIDFSMYYVAQYLMLRRTMPSSRDALVRTVASVGPGVATGAITTAVAFFMAGLTEFTGVAELGVIAGGGILLCWIAGLTMLPAMIYLVDTKWPSKHVPVPVDVRSWLEPLFSRPRLLLAVTSVGTILLAFGLNRLWYDHNLLHLQARGLESVDLEQKLLAQTGQNASFALSVAENAEDALARKARFLQLPSVKRVETVASRFPEDVDRKRPIVQRIAGRLERLPDRVPQIPVSMPTELGRMAAMAGPLGDNPRAGPLERALGDVAQQLQGLDPEQCYARLAEFQQRAAEEILARLHSLQAVANPEPPELTDLPQSLVNRFVSRNGRHLLQIYSKDDIWDMSAMKQFVADVRSVDPRATGNPLQVYEASLQMKRSYEQAALYAMAIILPVVFLDFLSIRNTILALLPLGLGILNLFALMGVLNIPLNPANMIVLPLILGIGIDAGVHVVHDFRAQRGRYRINASTASAVVVNTATNMAGFGSMMIASHRGLQSLGRVLTLGLATCLFTSLIMLPALLTLLSRNRREEAEEATEATEEPSSEESTTPSQRIYRRDSPHRSGAPRPSVPSQVQRPEVGTRAADE
jgi:hopanoid biosynthesis associated RND transporter like protein HpnN